MNALNISEKTTSAKAFRNRINTAKMLGLNCVEVEKSSKLFLDKSTIEVYKLYEQEMKKANSLDFGDLLLKVYELFRMYPAVLEEYQNQFKYIMVDEYQDTNHLQYLLVKMLAQKSRNLCVVGDEDQSIYSWRGADIRNILDFERDFPEAKVVKLEENYRSSKNIVSAASAVVKHNTERKDKTLFTQNPAGDLIQVREERTEYDEAKYVVKTIQSYILQGEGTHADYAIFYRTNAQSRVLEEQLRTHSIPYQIVGGVRFYERMEIKDILSYMKLSVNPNDDIAFKRIVNVPTRGIGKTTVDRIEELSIAHKLSMLEAAKKAIDEREFNAGTTNKLRNFVNLMAELQMNSAEHSLVDYYQIVLEKTQYLQKLKSEESAEADARIQNLEELSNALMQFMKEREDSTLVEFLEEMALVSDADSMSDNIQGVTLMTLHVSKGLEFPYVFVVGLEENLFPSAMSSDEDENSEMEEERRLCYVGMTRARQKLFLTYTRSRRVWGQEQFNPPSRFLKEIPKEYVQFSTAAEASTPRFVSNYKEKYSKNNSNNDFQDFPDYDNSFTASSANYNKGMKVRHPTFGVGSVFQVEGSGDQEKVTVLFADQTIKKFVTKYARLERL